MPEHRTIAIVLSRHDNPPFLLSDKIVSDKDKEVSSVLSEEIVPSYSLVQKHETHLRRRRLLLPIAYLLNNRIVTIRRLNGWALISSDLISKVSTCIKCTETRECLVLIAPYQACGAGKSEESGCHDSLQYFGNYMDENYDTKREESWVI